MARRLASGYAMGRNGPGPVPDRDWIDAGAGQAYSTPRDMARFAEALLRGGANEHGRILEPATLAEFAPTWRPPRQGIRNRQRSWLKFSRALSDMTN